MCSRRSNLGAVLVRRQTATVPYPINLALCALRRRAHRTSHQFGASVYAMATQVRRTAILRCHLVVIFGNYIACRLITKIRRSDTRPALSAPRRNHVTPLPMNFLHDRPLPALLSIYLKHQAKHEWLLICAIRIFLENDLPMMWTKLEYLW